MSNKPPPTFQCEFCGKTAEYRLSKSKNGRPAGYQKKQRFCSKDCGYAGRKWRPINPNGYVASSGYVKLHLRGGGKKLMQRKVMEDELARPLERHETVHHKNGDRLDNRPSNLELWSKMQPAGQRVVDKVQFAIEILTLYPEFAAQAGYALIKLDHVNAEAAAPELQPGHS